MRTSLCAAILAFTLIGSSSAASAFCGFYVAGAESELFADATTVVMMREGSTTALSMQNDYRGPVEDFAMVVPVPVVLSEENVRTLPHEVFDRVDRLAAPRLVEYWEEDPCRRTVDPLMGLANFGAIGRGGGGTGYGSGRPLVRVEAEFAVGEYEVVILSADDSGALDGWLRENGYSIPDGAGDALAPYVQQGMKFFVAKVDVEKVTFDEGRASLSPLRVHYTSDEFSLPIRLGMLNSSGTQDLIVHVLARDQRYEAANFDNVTIPTNLDVSDEVREKFGAFYAALFDRTLEGHPNAVVTEYAWQATNCDPCPGPVLSSRDLLTLGADILFDISVPDGGDDWGSRVRVGDPTAQNEYSPANVRRIVRRHLNELRSCHENSLRGRGAGGTTIGATASILLDRRGGVLRPGLEGVPDARMRACLENAMSRWRFPSPRSSEPTRITIPFEFVADSSRPPMGSRRGVGQFQSFVLTRLHYRYGRGELGDDLVFRAAGPIEGGREFSRDDEGNRSTGARTAAANNFQGRYAIRHAWEGDIACENPTRGRWGANPNPPSGASSDPPPLAATDLGTQPRGGIHLAAALRQPVPALGLEEIGPDAPPEPELVPEPEPEPEPIPEPDRGADSAASPTTGCGCSAPGFLSGSPSSLALTALLAFIALTLRRRCYR